MDFAKISHVFEPSFTQLFMVDFLLTPESASLLYVLIYFLEVIEQFSVIVTPDFVSINQISIEIIQLHVVLLHGYPVK